MGNEDQYMCRELSLGNDELGVRLHIGLTKETLVVCVCERESLELGIFPSFSLRL